MLMLALGLMVVAPSCTNLDEELFSQVSSDNFFKTEEELISALGAAYTSLYGFAGNTSVWGAQEVSSDEVVVPTSQLLVVVSISSSSSCIKWLLFQSRSSFRTI